MSRTKQLNGRRPPGNQTSAKGYDPRGVYHDEMDASSEHVPTPLRRDASKTTPPDPLLAASLVTGW